MNIIQRVESKELRSFRILHNRKMFSIDNAEHLARLEKGYEGEIMFDERIDRLSKQWLILNDMQLESNHADFQIDSVAIVQKTILMFEIKNLKEIIILKMNNGIT